MMGQGKSGWLIAGICGAVVLTSFGYGMGRRAALKSVASSLNTTPAGAPLPTIQIEPIQPQEELAAINASKPAVGQQVAAAAQSPTMTEAQTPAAVSAAGPDPAAAPASLSATTKGESARNREIQLALKAAGFDPGSTDGRLGPRTRTAIRDFQLAHGLEADGKVGPRTWSKLEPFLNGTQTSQASQKQAD